MKHRSSDKTAAELAIEISDIVVEYFTVNDEKVHQRLWDRLGRLQTAYYHRRLRDSSADVTA